MRTTVAVEMQSNIFDMANMIYQLVLRQRPEPAFRCRPQTTQQNMDLIAKI